MVRLAFQGASEASVPRNSDVIDGAQSMLLEQAEAISRVAHRLDRAFEDAVALILSCRGRLVVCGIGKSGLIGRKLSATFSSTGTPSFFLHPGEAAHGDLGMVTADDVVLAISNSAETEEIVRILPILRDAAIPIIAVVGNQEGTIARLANVVLDSGVEREACPLNLAPTTSTLVSLALGDALAVALSRARNFGPSDFARFHPAGALGRRLCTRVRDIMQRIGLPFVTVHQPLEQVLFRMTEGRVGLAIVLDDEKNLVGVLTDGDLRRTLQRNAGALNLPVCEVMSSDPVVIYEGATLAEAEELMRARRIKALIVVDKDRRVQGIVDIFAKR